MSTVLVTGGAGYIGSHMCKVLSENGYRPVTFDNLSTGHIEAVCWGPFFKGDLRDQKAIDEAFSQYQPKAIMHFAASALVVESLQNPSLYYENNLISTLNLLNMCLKYKIQYFIFSSTCASYGLPKKIPIQESEPQFPIHPYGQSKYMIETLLKDYEKAYNLKYAALRYFNVAGADFEGKIGENHFPETHLIPLVIQTALKLREEFVIFGSDFATPDGTAKRDFIHVMDVANAHLKALQFIQNKNQSLVVNLGAGVGFSVLEIIQAVENLLGKKIPYRIAPQRQGEPAELIADITKSTKIGLQPKHSDLATILKTALSWHEKLRSSYV